MLSTRALKLEAGGLGGIPAACVAATVARPPTAHRTKIRVLISSCRTLPALGYSGTGEGHDLAGVRLTVGTEHGNRPCGGPAKADRKPEQCCLARRPARASSHLDELCSVSSS